MNNKPWNILKEQDSELYSLIELEFKRQIFGIELIASENYASEAVITTAGSILTNKYAEGLPNKRYYGGCEHVDRIEQLAIDRATKLFSAKYANVQPHSGANANAAVYLALCKAGDKVLGMDLSNGGHLTHGSKVNFSGILYEAHSYNLDPKTELIDYENIANKAKELKPKMIIAGASAYSRKIDFAKFREIADSVGAYLLVDMAHIAGLVAAGLHESPLPYADVVTSTTHKTLRGPRGGIILWNDDSLTKQLNKAVFPGMQGGPLEHIIAAKAVCFLEASKDNFVTYQKQVLANTKALGVELENNGVRLVSNGSDNHLLLLDLSSKDISGKDLEIALGKVNITVNKNTIPNETRSPFVTSGIRVGAPAITTRGMQEKECTKIARWISAISDNITDEKLLSNIASEVNELSSSFPLYSNWM